MNFILHPWIRASCFVSFSPVEKCGCALQLSGLNLQCKMSACLSDDEIQSMSALLKIETGLNWRRTFLPDWKCLKKPLDDKQFVFHIHIHVHISISIYEASHRHLSCWVILCHASRHGKACTVFKYICAQTKVKDYRPGDDGTLRSVQLLGNPPSPPKAASLTAFSQLFVFDAFP